MFGIYCYILYIGISITLQRIAQTFSLKAAEDGCSLKAAGDGCSLKTAEDGCSLLDNTSKLVGPKAALLGRKQEN